MKQPNPEAETMEHLSPIAARMMLVAFPAHIREAFERRAKEIDYPIEAVLEMAIAGFLDSECLGFTDCKPRY
jgi:phage/plasmid-associated DNA primase